MISDKSVHQNRSMHLLGALSRWAALCVLALSALSCMDKTITSTDSPVTVTTIQYGGITSATETGLNTGTVSYALAPSGENITAINIDCQARNGAVVTLATASPTSTSSNLTGLASGTTYTCSAHAVVGGVEDPNAVTASMQTQSVSFGSGNGAIGTYAYRGFQLVQAYGDAPGAPTGTPSQREVVLTWLPFTGASALTKYQISRIAAGAGPVDMTVSTPCTATTTTSCLVCTSTGSGSIPQSCTDPNIGSEPSQYEYAVSEIVNGSVEELPSSPIPALGSKAFETFVPIPPANMVLTQRDSVNYEMCTNVGIAASGTVSDPLHNQRCSYAGIAATPYNSNPNGVPIVLDLGYYDFGYDLFVDRWTTACNWTPASAGGMCGAGGISGNCYGAGLAPATIGTNGNVYWDASDSLCEVMVSGTWQYYTAAPTTALTNAASQTAQKPPLIVQPYLGYTSTGNWLGTVVNLCNVTDPTYGAKRLPRRREQIAFSAFPMSGDPGYYSGNIGWLEGAANGSSSLSAGHVCNTNQGTGLVRSGFNVDQFASTYAYSYDVNIGSVATSGCLSRYGAQDVIGNIGQATSEGIAWTNTTGVPYNSYDNGDREWNALKIDGTELPAPTSNNVGWSGGPYFNMVLGVPLVTNEGGVDPLFGSAFEASYYMGNSVDDGSLTGGYSNTCNGCGGAVWYGMGAGSQFGYLFGAGRFGMYAQAQLDSGAEFPAGGRCVLPAE